MSAFRPALVEFLVALRDAEDMPMHHAADIDQYLVEVLGVSVEYPRDLRATRKVLNAAEAVEAQASRDWRDNHWLKFTVKPEPDRGPIVGCHCGFESNLEESCGWGDDVVSHIVAVARG